ncbi:hypothetical protein [Lacipirellula sp.]|uniref:hypothetical protein n=1 Tax=Lacipirellula sp. TaxID=2691419 RepID=UPI003D128BA8
MNRFYIKLGVVAFLGAALVMLAARQQTPPRATRAEVDDMLHNYFAVDGKSLAIVDADVGFWTEVPNSLHMRVQTDRESGERLASQLASRAAVAYTGSVPVEPSLDEDDEWEIYRIARSIYPYPLERWNVNACDHFGTHDDQRWAWRVDPATDTAEFYLACDADEAEPLMKPILQRGAPTKPYDSSSMPSQAKALYLLRGLESAE